MVICQSTQKMKKRKQSLTLALTIASQVCRGKESTCQYRRQEMWVRSLGQEDPLEEEMATHPSILALEIPWTEEPGGL